MRLQVPAPLNTMKYVATVRYGLMRNTGRFFAGFSGLHMGDFCIIRTERGVEVGEIVSTVKLLPEGAEETFAGEILRQASAADREKYRRIQEEDEPREFQFCQQKIRERGLPMKLACVEHLFGDNKIIFYFLADGRVDFRELVKDLAQQYHVRIEMRQIGVRDEARLLGYVEHCGRELCCKTFIKQLEPVTMKMAKNQKATLDPGKISGRCGRLMCCLRFEDAIYEELRRNLPRKGALVQTPKGRGTVTGTEILAQTVSVEFEGGGETVFPVSQIEVLSDVAAPLASQDEVSSPDAAEDYEALNTENHLASRPRDDAGAASTSGSESASETQNDGAGSNE